MTNTTIVISTRDGDGSAPYVFKIIDGSGRTVETVEYESANYNVYELDSLYEAVSVNSSGVDEKLGEIFTELGIEEPPF
ncbi:hypothetical protein [Rhodococcus sp. 1168]|uniref:hypothetical protein n=1 Tax=Rhodococcus sp. 1168 TaxID=2018041 RepID=UPI000F738D85|nr:hypothetical protein [Rhodococcus sp. 1168]